MRRAHIIVEFTVTEYVADADTGRFRPELRVKGLQGAPGFYETTWGPGRARHLPVRARAAPGTPHVIWRRIGTHAIFDPGPP